MASLGARRLLPSLVSRRLSPFPRAFPRLPTGAAPLSSDEPPPPPRSGPSDPSGTAAGEGPHGAHRNRRSGGAGDYEEEQGRVLRAALSHVLGWSESAMIAGAKDAGVSPSIVGAFPRKEAALVEFFMDDCLQRLIDRIDSGEELKDLILSERLSKLIRRRLEMQAPYISRWPQALSIQAQPANLPTSFKQRAMLVDEFWHAAGDTGLDIDWYVKRTVLGEFRDTWMFVDNRIKDAFDLQKTVLEAAYLAEAVGAGVGNSMQGFMRKIFHQ
ncbi:Ubiquinone biosynthesis protein COQ9, mitochondrial [Ananas comosus]|uniref:Ubiquinone biosynthesis protein n=1 Tax=Ananas comosus TaxID=4615 RepID=A0A199UPC6_ANACO|nr:Ubiquinone biosynthesis protein COQ9, mitochondrial [Ananas comosus]